MTITPSRPRSRMLVLTCTMLAALTLTACGADETATPASQSTAATSSQEASDNGTTREVETAFGTVTIPTAPKRIVALEGGAGPVLESGLMPVATADGNKPEAFLPEEYAEISELPIVLTPDGWDYERIAALEPDLMVGFVRGGTEEELSAEKKADFEKLNAIAPTVFIRSDGSGATKDASYQIKTALGHEDLAKQAKAAYEAKAAEVKSAHAQVLGETTFAAMDAYEDEVSVYSPSSWIGSVLTDSGAQIVPLAAQETGQNAVFLSKEQLGRVANADVVLYSETVDGEPDLGAKDLQAVPTYATLPAVKAGHAYGVPYFFADRYSTATLALQRLDDILDKLDE